MSDIAELLRRCHEGDAAAFAELVAHDGAWIGDHVHRRLGPALRARVDTQDIVQNTLLEVLRSGPRFVVDDRAQMRALLVRMVENVLRHQARHDRQQRRDVRREQPLAPASGDSVLQLSPPTAAGPATQAAAGEQRDWVRLALELLEPDDRDVLVWREFEGLPFATIADRLGLAEAHARVRFQRALPKLGRKLQLLQQGRLGEALES
ncbi:MAG: sigma-70 family RNA polymerase sigma factor [Planctomycetes bacterium]|nr:sigma-70 family RNA polymerase sigma factor [Planctomycetota bacterium]